MGDRGRSVRHTIALLACALCAACAIAPKLADASRSGVFGYLELVPREGLPEAPSAGASAAYGDRRLAHAKLVDYEHPGFAVVYLEGASQAASAALQLGELRVTDGLRGIRLEPSEAAISAPGRIRIVNETAKLRLVSCPSLGFLAPLAPGAVTTLVVEEPGGLEVFLPGTEARADWFAAPGGFDVVDAAGRFELLGVPPGAYTLAAWHPRFPATRERVLLRAGEVRRFDLRMGVGLAAAEESRGEP